MFFYYIPSIYQYTQNTHIPIIPNIQSYQNKATHSSIILPSIIQQNIQNYNNIEFHQDRPSKIQKPVQKHNKLKVQKPRIIVHQKINSKNVMPNICKKMLNFICSGRYKSLIKQLYPMISQYQINNFINFAQSYKKQSHYYLGNKHLNEIWFGSCEKDLFQQIFRVLSYHYLNNYACLGILLSKKIKPGTKQLHLKYVRKLKKSLKNSVL